MNLQLEKTDIKSLISQKLRGLGVVGFTQEEPIPGPIITGYPISLHTSTRIKDITSKNEEIALALNVDSITIERIKNKIVIFVPNEDRKIIDFKDALYWFLTNEEVDKMTLPILLGQDFQGNKAALDLTLQPHILIAGSTGSGKSVFESAIIAALAMKKDPKDLDIYLVDTKRVDLSLFEDLKHVKSVAKDINDWYSMINEIYKKVQERNKKFEAKGVRNISEYNLNGGQMHHIVLIIDELADLIEKDKMEREGVKNFPEPKVDEALKRVIQICRASGIHIIACTQRTTVDVVSGTIKANFPTRISLRLPQSNDSRAILGENGAENLLGRGDMLIKQNDSDILKRYHGPFVNLDDIERIINQREQILQSFGIGA